MSTASRDADAYFTSRRPPVFRRQGSLLVFDSPCSGDSPNSVARAQVYDCGNRRRAIVLLPYWNATREACRPFGTLLARCGVTCVQLSLPYHDERQTIGVGFARELACENLGSDHPVEPPSRAGYPRLPDLARAGRLPADRDRGGEHRRLHRVDRRRHRCARTRGRPVADGRRLRRRGLDRQRHAPCPDQPRARLHPR